MSNYNLLQSILGTKHCAFAISGIYIGIGKDYSFSRDVHFGNSFVTTFNAAEEKTLWYVENTQDVIDFLIQHVETNHKELFNGTLRKTYTALLENNLDARVLLCI